MVMDTSVRTPLMTSMIVAALLLSSYSAFRSNGVWCCICQFLNQTHGYNSLEQGAYLLGETVLMGS